MNRLVSQWRNARKLRDEKEKKTSKQTINHHPCKKEMGSEPDAIYLRVWACGVWWSVVLTHHLWGLFIRCPMPPCHVPLPPQVLAKWQEARVQGVFVKALALRRTQRTGSGFTWEWDTQLNWFYASFILYTRFYCLRSTTLRPINYRRERTILFGSI
jgi:hypothetical protein